MSQTTDDATISYPSIALVLGIAFIIYRYYFKPSTSSATTSTSGTSRAGLHFTESQVESVSGMFPQLSRRDIMWDLQRNRGSVNATVERVLGGRGLDPAPPSFQPPVPQSAPTSTSQSSTQQSTLSSLLSGSSKKAEPDLITRYNLQDRVQSSDKGKAAEQRIPTDARGQSTGSWGASKTERSDLLKRRRDEMILEARRKMMERDASRGTT